MEDIIKGIQINSAGFGTISKLAMQDRRLHITALGLTNEKICAII